MTALHDQLLKETNELTNIKKKNTAIFHSDYSLNLHNINPLSPKSNQHQIYPCNINAL